MKVLHICLVALAVSLGAANARASFHLWNIKEVFSTADGSVQFIELFTSSNSQQFTNGRTITTAVNSNTFVFPSNTPSPTSNHHLLLATPGFETLPGGVTADFVIPSSFFSPNGDTINFVGADSVSFVSLPTNGTDSLQFPGASTGQNSPTNYAGQMGMLLSQPPGMSADFDQDGDVDGDDFLAWQAAFGCSSGCSVDADGDDDTDGDDFLAWQAQFGSGVASTGSSRAVPEPSSWLLLLAGLAAAVRPRGRLATP